MRIAEAQITLGVIAAREGDLDEAVAHGRRALAGDRKSLPSLAMVSHDLGRLIHNPGSRSRPRRSGRLPHDHKMGCE